MQANVLVFSYVASAVIAAAVAVAAWRRRPVPGTPPLALLMTAVAWWLVANAFEAATTDLTTKIAWSIVAYPGIVSVPVLFFVFALRWTHQDHTLTRLRIALLCAVPALSVALAATNSWHHLLWPSVTLVNAWGVTAVYTHGPWFWIELAYAYAVAGAGFLALVVAVRRHPGFYSGRTRTAMLASCVPVVASAVYAAGLDTSLHADLSSIAFAATGLVAAWGILRSGVLDPVPIAWATLVDMLPDAVIVLGPEGALAALNPSASRMLRIGQKAIGRPAEEFLSRLPELAEVARASRDTETEVRVEQSAASSAGDASDAARRSSERWFNVRLNVIEDMHGRDLGRILVVRDVTERRRMVETIRQLSLTDELTGLLNRRGFMTLAEQQVRNSMRARSRFWLLFGDVDGLKEINDRLGHEAGDEALREIARLLRESVFREADIVARFGGDEFVILASESGRAEGNEFLGRIQATLRQRSETMDDSLPLSLSVGAAVFDPAHPASLEDLIREADAQMYLRKRSRRNGDDGRSLPLEEAS